MDAARAHGCLDPLEDTENYFRHVIRLCLSALPLSCPLPLHYMSLNGFVTTFSALAIHLTHEKKFKERGHL